MGEGGDHTAYPVQERGSELEVHTTGSKASPTKEKPASVTLDGLLSSYMSKQGLQLMAEESPRGLRSPLTRYVNDHWDELKSPTGQTVGGACVIPAEVSKAVKNPRQGMRQAMLTVVARRYGEAYKPKEGARAVTVRQVLKEGKPAHAVAILFAREAVESAKD